MGRCNESAADSLYADEREPAHTVDAPGILYTQRVGRQHVKAGGVSCGQQSAARSSAALPWTAGSLVAGHSPLTSEGTPRIWGKPVHQLRLRLLLLLPFWHVKATSDVILERGGGDPGMWKHHQNLKVRRDFHNKNYHSNCVGNIQTAHSGFGKSLRSRHALVFKRRGVCFELSPASVEENSGQNFHIYHID